MEGLENSESKRLKFCAYFRAEPILLFFHLFFFPAILYFLPIFFTQYFAHYLAIFLLIKGFSWCCIRVIHNMVTALLECLDLLAVFPEAYVDL